MASTDARVETIRSIRPAKQILPRGLNLRDNKLRVCSRKPGGMRAKRSAYPKVSSRRGIPRWGGDARCLNHDLQSELDPSIHRAID